MQKRDKYSVWALIFILASETFAILAMRSDIPWFWYGTLMTILATFVVLLIGNEDGMDFKPKSVVASNLLANAIAPRIISAFYLLFFVIHLGWLTDSTFNLFLPNAYKDSWEVIVSLIGGIIGTSFLITFFPRSGSKKDENVTTMYISGISTPSIPREQTYEKLNLRPFVRILQMTSDNNTDKFKLLILKTDMLKSDKSFAQQLINVFEFIKQNTQEQNITHFEPIENEFTECSKQISDDNIEKMVKILILAVAQKEFENREWLNPFLELVGKDTQNMEEKNKAVLKWFEELEKKIEFTSSCNYNDFNDCYKVLNQKISHIDEKHHLLVFNLTPGTSAVGGLMTLMAIDPKRELYYYSQDENIADKKRMIKIDKDYESLKNQFSKTLEKIQDQER